MNVWFVWNARENDPNNHNYPNAAGFTLQIQMQVVYAHMVQQSKVITISGRPGIGKTEVSDVKAL